MNGKDIVNAIMNGKADDSLSEIMNAAHHRRKSVALIKSAEIKIGDRVRFTQIKPKYLEGSTGIVREKNIDKFEIELDDKFVKMRASRYIHPTKGTITAPISTVEVIPKE